MIIPDVLLEGQPRANKVLIDILHEIDRRLDEIKIIDSAPSGNTERSTLVYDRTTKNLLISDTTEWRKIVTEAL